MRAALIPTVLGLICLGPLSAPGWADEDPSPAWTAPAPVDAVQVLDADGDGKQEIVAVSGRQVHVFRGGAPLRPARTHAVDRDQSLAIVVPALDDSTPRLLTLGTTGAQVRPLLAEGPTRTRADDGLPLDWADHDGLLLTDTRMPRGMVVPRRTGWLYTPFGPEDDIALEVTLDRKVIPGGPFLEDSAEVQVSWPRPVLGGAPVDAPGRALWALSGTSLVCQGRGGRTTWDLGFLPAEGDRWLVDLDADGRPDVLHRSGDNRKGEYAFFRTPPSSAEAWPETGRPFGSPAALLRLSGFQLDPQFVDLDGDGRRDLVLTTIEVDARNLIRAMTSGRVTARTRAFRNRSAAGEGTRFFVDTPDAVVDSELGVTIRFTVTGAIEVERHLTIEPRADLDGDGRKDLAIRTGPTTLHVHAGVAEGVWSKAPRTVTIPDTTRTTQVESHPVDRDGDGTVGLLLLYRGAQDAIHVVGD